MNEEPGPYPMGVIGSGDVGSVDEMKDAEFNALKRKVADLENLNETLREKYKRSDEAHTEAVNDRDRYYGETEELKTKLTDVEHKLERCLQALEYICILHVDSIADHSNDMYRAAQNALDDMGLFGKGLKVGDLVKRKDMQPLRSGACGYMRAVVISVCPFVLASMKGDMRWESTVSPEQFRKVCKAPEAVMEAAMRRLNG